jgi:hypothetical protein
MNEQEKDTMKDVFINQGHVPKDCRLPGMIIYEELWNRQVHCRACAGSPPGPETEYKCPYCLRIVDKDVADEFIGRASEEYVLQRMQLHDEAYVRSKSTSVSKNRGMRIRLLIGACPEDDKDILREKIDKYIEEKGVRSLGFIGNEYDFLLLNPYWIPDCIELKDE